VKRPVAVALACVLLLLGAWLLYELAFRDEAPAAVAPTPSRPAAPTPVGPTPAPSTFEITEVSGTVEVRRGAIWVPIKPGDRLGTADAIRTQNDGRAVLRGASGDELRLRERVELEIGKLSSFTSELRLRKGKVRAQAAPGTESLQINSGEAQAVGKGGGRFTVFADPRGAVTVASETGDTEVIAQGASVTVGAGKQTYVAPGKKPGDPVPIPDEVFLQVAWPSGEIHARSVHVRGKAEKGSMLTVNGQETAVGEDGTFATQVPLREGKNRVSVTAEAMSGETKEKSGEVNVNTKGPPLEVDPGKTFGDPKKRAGP